MKYKHKKRNVEKIKVIIVKKNKIHKNLLKKLIVNGENILDKTETAN